MPIDKQIQMANQKNNPAESEQPDTNDRILYLLEENQKLTKEIHKIVHKMKKQMFWQSIFGFIRVLVIVVPLLLGIWYLSPYVKDAYSQYQQILDLGNQTGSVNLDNLPQGVLDLIK